jgi:carboxyl-terminal processing protease
MNHRRPIVLVVLLSALVPAVVSGCRSAPSGARGAASAVPALTLEQRELYARSFDQVWQTVRDKHFDPTLGGLDWEAVRAELRPKIETAATAPEARAIMSDMLGRLKQTHFGIIPGDAYDAVAPTSAAGDAAKGADADDAARAQGSGDSGLTLRVEGGRAIVTAVRAGTPASERFRPGEIVESVNGRALTPRIEAVERAYATSTLREAMLIRAVEGALTGDPGDELALGVIDASDRLVERELTLAEPAGSLSTFGNLPAMRVLLESRRIPGPSGPTSDIGVIALNIFLDPVRVMPEFGRAVEGFEDCAGVVLDLRGNPGGIGAMAMGMGGWFVTQPDQRLGELRTRGSSVRFFLNPRARAFTGPVAVLVDGGSLSTSEILAGGLQDLGRARVFGTPTGGAALPSVVERLPSGDGFQYAFANYVSVGGRQLEGSGVTPDVIVRPDRSRLLAGSDPVLESAVEWIRSQPRR